jgi:cytochrome c oxidase assembly protein subunit 15
VPKLVGGVRFEYGHRVAAGIVVILTLTMALWAWLGEPRAWVRKTALVAVGLIFAQAILGGITVLYLLPLPVAVAHAGTAQAFFCLMVAMAAITNSQWDSIEKQEEPPGHPGIRILAALTTGLIYVQILIGAVMRHMGAGLAIPDFPLVYGGLIPPQWTAPIAVNFAHRCGAIVVCVIVIWTAAVLFKRNRSEVYLIRPLIGLLVLLLLQITLGALTIWSGRAVLPTTAHVACGAAVLATSFLITLRVFHLYAPRSAAALPGWMDKVAHGRAAAEGR